MRELASTLAMSPTTFYNVIRLAIEALVWVQRWKGSVDAFVLQVRAGEARLAQVTQLCTQAQRRVGELTQAFEQAQETIRALQGDVSRLTAQWTLLSDRLIVVLTMSGRCTVRSIVEVLHYGMGKEVSVGYVQGVIARAGTHARPLLSRLLEEGMISGAMCIDEIFLKELGTRIVGGGDCRSGEWADLASRAML